MFWKKKKVVGIMMGTPTVSPDNGNQYMPGCMAEHLTSMAGMFDNQVQRMKLSELQKTIENYFSELQNGKELKKKNIKIVLNKLRALQKKNRKAHAKEKSAKAKKKLQSKHQITKAQIKKARKLLKKLDT
jgi:hypothetical protein